MSTVDSREKALAGDKNLKVVSIEVKYKVLRIRTSLVVQWFILHFQCQGHGFNPRSGNLRSYKLAAWPNNNLF